jgi:hypothetical protein
MVVLKHPIFLLGHRDKVLLPVWRQGMRDPRLGMRRPRLIASPQLFLYL